MASLVAKVSHGRLIVNDRQILNLNSLSSFFYRIFRFLIIVGISYVILFPLIVKFSSSVMTRTDIWDSSVVLIPKHPSMNNYRLAYQFMEYPVAFMNSLTLTLGVSIFQLVSCTVVAYGFARFKFFGSGLWFALVIFSLIIPPEMILIPLYLNFRFFDLWGILPDGGINLLGSNWPFLLPALSASGFKNGLYIYIMRQIFKGMPKELEEAAYVDGAGTFKTFFTVMLPGALHGLVIVFLFSFVWQWNDFSLTSFYLPDATVLPITLSNLARAVLGDQYLHAPVEGSLVNNAGSFMLILPVLIVYAFLQRYFVESVERSGLTG